MEHLKIILEIPRKEKLYAKFKKCKFWLNRVGFLDHIIIARGIEVDLGKGKEIANWPWPTNIREGCSFLGLAVYYRRVIEGFTKIDILMFQLKRVNVKF